jgi:hypothetical protein
MDIEATKVTLDSYCRLMTAIKSRTAVILALLDQRQLMPDFCAAELIKLQTRMICETLAISCLLVHGDIEGARTARLTSAYQADFIMNALERLHPNFYPRPTRQIVRDGAVVGWEDIKDGFLSKQELLKSYHAAGEFLHAGHLVDFLSGRQKLVDPLEVRTWVAKLTTLLSHHHIFLSDSPTTWDGKEPLRFTSGETAPKYQIIAMMATEPDGVPGATVFECIRQASPEPLNR